MCLQNNILHTDTRKHLLNILFSGQVLQHTVLYTIVPRAIPAIVVSVGSNFSVRFYCNNKEYANEEW